MRFFDDAADLVSLGFKVFPLVPGRKLPLIEAWQKQASDDADVIGEWAARWPNANIGIATGESSGVVVLDLDVKDSRNGVQDLAALRQRGQALPPCPIALTPSGGRHLFFAAAPGLKNVVGISRSGRGVGLGIDAELRKK
jgi:putative DNA primase/helicase